MIKKEAMILSAMILLVLVLALTWLIAPKILLGFCVAVVILGFCSLLWLCLAMLIHNIITYFEKNK